MNELINSAREFLKVGDVDRAERQLGLIRPGLRGELAVLRLWCEIHQARGHWSNLDALCRLIRKDFPGERFGFSLGAESLHRQGRTEDAIALLKERGGEAAEDPDDLYELARYHCKLNSVLAATLLLQTAFGRNGSLRDKAFSDQDLAAAWPGLQDGWQTAASVQDGDAGV